MARIRAVWGRALSVPLHTPFVTALRRTSTIDTLVVTVLTVDGILGLGEAPQVWAVTGESVASAAACVEQVLAPVLVGLLVVAIGAAFGWNTGYAINPARDFGPRLFTFMAGWGGEVFTAANGWWWVPIVAPCVGTVAGAWVYDLCVGHRFPVTTADTV